MSSLTPQPTISSEPPPDVPSEGGDSGGMQRGASYFFGFLITFVILLLLFVGCGVVSRRRYAARRRARFEWNMQPWAERMGSDIGYVPPVLQEKYLLRARDESQWRHLNPLAALVACTHQENSIPKPDTQLHRGHPHPTTANDRSDMNLHLEVISRTLSSQSQNRSEPHTRITRPTPYHRNPNIVLTQQEAEQLGQGPQQHSWLHHLNPSSCLTFLNRRWQRAPREPSNEEDLERINSIEKSRDLENEEKQKSLQVALLIQMPSPIQRTSRGGESIAEYSVGVATLPWTDSLKESSRER